MNKILLLFFLLSVETVWCQKATYVVIAEIYGAGGNSGATSKNDYVTIYNPTASSVDLSTWSIQYATQNGTSYTVINLSGSVSAGSYYLIQLGSGGSNGVNLPTTPNVTNSLNINASTGKIVLSSGQTAISGKTDLSVVDFVGYGTGSNTPSEYEGAGSAASPTTTKSICRLDDSGNQTYGVNGSGYDSNNNNSDFFQKSSPSPLPVELTSFTSDVADNKVTLNWSTATEVNNYGFEILRRVYTERSEGAQNDNWKKVGFVQGNGNSNSLKKYSFTDEPTRGKEFQYRLKQIDFNGAFEYSEIITVVIENVSEFKLAQNYPNPFNPITRISYTLPMRSNVKLRVYDLLAQKVAELVDGIQEAGRYEITFDGSNLPSGAYFYKLEAGNYVEVKKLLLVK